MNPFDELKGFDTYNYVMGHKEEFKKSTKMSMWAQYGDYFSIKVDLNLFY